MEAADRVVQAIMAKGTPFAMAVMGRLVTALHGRHDKDKTTSAWLADGDSWIRKTWDGSTVLVHVRPSQKKWVVAISVEAGAFPGKSNTLHRNSRRAKQVADQGLARLGWDVLAPEEGTTT